jgi:7,8-dihydropterin-6-yl-methyl-4-(beta-D-ribofuranosyl)aminobenzene 5'-phosphate synthase
MGRITILYDNRRVREDLTPGWGFSAFIEGFEKKILFDTGADRLVLEHNAGALGVDLASTDLLVLSHAHCDHIGALSSALHQGVTVYYPASFPLSFGERLEAAKASARPVKESQQILAGVHTTGELGERIKEQGLVLKGEHGPVLMVGCAHPGLVPMVEAAMESAGGPLWLVLGGFHLAEKDAREVQTIALQLLGMGVEQVAPCHCSGDRAVAILKDTFKEACLDIRAGSEVLF